MPCLRGVRIWYSNVLRIPKRSLKKKKRTIPHPTPQKPILVALRALRTVKNEEGEGQQAAGESAGEMTEAALQAMNVETLRKVAKSKGIQGYGNMNKETLIAMILNH